ncbi:MAG: hypothetical protein NZ954_05985 [Thermofilaceae archaeon]|nr:hypothetical protein [Thermofilaceae archaeon]MCX8179836.1 hypothetical protein [Thermofilaceae archaeon]MDW8004362.1 BadF/BadG/BcrA/BcrD ATPase family protein [Thermofilaceae archaeon]
MSEHQLAAVDGGGSGSRVLVFRSDGRPLALFKGPPLNYAALGPSAFLRNLRLLLNTVAEGLGGPLEGYVFSLAGVSAFKRDVEQLLLSELHPSRVWLLSDIEATYMAAAFGRDAIVVSSGTGSFAYGRRGGREARAGGWGYLFGDEGSGYWIGREFVRRVLMYYDGRLTGGELSAKLLLEALDATSVVEAVSKLYTRYTSPRKVAKLAKVACRAAEQGCRLARELFEDAASQLYLMVSSVAERLGFGCGVHVYGTGGVILGCKQLAAALELRVKQEGGIFNVVSAHPLVGCVLYYLQVVEGFSVEELESINIDITVFDC